MSVATTTSTKSESTIRGWATYNRKVVNYDMPRSVVESAMFLMLAQPTKLFFAIHR